MHYDILTEKLSKYRPQLIATTPAGDLDPDSTADEVLAGLGRLCQHLKPLEGIDVIALAVCKYTAMATTPTEKAVAVKAAEALAGLIRHNELLNTFTEPIEMMGTALVQSATDDLE